MTDLFWDEVLLTNNPDSKELEVSFKKVDGDGNLTSGGADGTDGEPGTPAGVDEDPDGTQPDTDDEGDFPSQPPGNGDPVPPIDHPECADTSCESWGEYEIAGYDGVDGWAGKVAKLYKTVADVASDGGTLAARDILVPDPLNEAKVYSNMFGGPTDFYPANKLKGGNIEPTEGMGTVEFYDNDYVEGFPSFDPRNTETVTGGICDAIHIGTADNRWVIRKDLDLAQTDGNPNPISSNRTNGTYGMVIGHDIIEDQYLNGALLPTYDLDSLGGGELGDIGNKFTLISNRRSYSFLAGGRKSNGTWEEPTNAVLQPNNTVSGSPIQLHVPRFRYGYVQVGRSGARTVGELRLGGGTLNIYKNEIVMISATGSTEKNKYYWQRIENPDTDGTANGWYTLEVECNYSLQGKVTPLDTITHEWGYKAFNESYATLYKNGRVLARFPYSQDTINLIVDDNGDPDPSNLWNDVVSVGLYGYRNVAGENVVTNPETGMLIQELRPQFPSVTTYLMYYEGEDAVNLPRSDFGQRMLRQANNFTIPEYCDRIPQ